MKKKELEKYVSNYLKSWTGNNPKKVLQYFGKNATFIDPANPKGLQNKESLKSYLTPLVKKNNAWTWEMQELIPNKNGCIVKSKAVIPLSKKNVEVNCIEIIELKGQKIIRNEIYFDQPKGYKVK